MSKRRLPPPGKLSPKVTDKGRPTGSNPFTGSNSTLFSHPALRGHLPPPKKKGGAQKIKRGNGTKKEHTIGKPTAFPPDESRLPFEILRDEPYREKIARLGQMITDRIPAKKGILTKDDPEYWGLASIVTDEMADVALKMKVRKPMTLPELVKATGKPAGELEPLLQQMAVVGLLADDWPQPPRLPRAGQVESGAGRV